MRWRAVNQHAFSFYLVCHIISLIDSLPAASSPFYLLYKLVFDQRLSGDRRQFTVRPESENPAPERANPLYVVSSQLFQSPAADPSQKSLSMLTPALAGINCAHPGRRSPEKLSRRLSGNAVVLPPYYWSLLCY